jgi:hypothetical protein
VRGARGDTVAKRFFDNSLVGDVVTATNSLDSTTAPDNGLNGSTAQRLNGSTAQRLNGWNMAWSAWGAGSAV